jgi:hypothetical protein
MLASRNFAARVCVSRGEPHLRTNVPETDVKAGNSAGEDKRRFDARAG